MNRLDEAKASLDQALARKLDVFAVRFAAYQLAFLQNNPTTMKEQVSWARGKPGSEDRFLFSQADTEAFYGRLQKARELTQQAVHSAMRNDAKEVAASYEAYAGVREAEFGEIAQARQQVTSALALFPQGMDVRLWTALTLALIRDVPHSQKQVDSIRNDFPNNTVVQAYWLPSIRASIQIANGDASKAIELLQAASSYELGGAQLLLPALVRGQSHLLAHNGPAAVVEFQKLLDHPGLIVQNRPFGALAHLGLARAYTLSSDNAKAKSAHQDFFALWNDADPDIPILKQAKVEYAKLQ